MWGIAGASNLFLSQRMLDAIPDPAPGETFTDFAKRVTEAGFKVNLNAMQADHFLLAAAHLSTAIRWNDDDESLLAEASRHPEFPSSLAWHYHGGPDGLPQNTELRPGKRSAICRFHDYFSAGNVYVTPRLNIAAYYAMDSRRHRTGAIYLVSVKSLRLDPLMIRFARLFSSYTGVSIGYFWPMLFDSLLAEGAVIRSIRPGPDYVKQYSYL